MAFIIASQCPVCKRLRDVGVEYWEVHHVSWVKFPQPLGQYETGVVSFLCGGAECRDKVRQDVGPRFIISERIRGR
jgi:hypothetical protein